MNDAPLGLCECGCGEVTPLATKTNAARGIVKGQPLRFVHGHNRRKPVVAEYLIAPNTGCWIWQRAIAHIRGGYGISYDGARPKDAHRIYYERVHGPVPKGYHLHHKCENPPCVNPDHLEPMPAGDHMRLTRRARARLTPETVREIRRAPTGYGTGKALAEKYGISDVYVCMIRKRQVWRDIE